MRPRIDLFHQLVLEQDGYIVIANYTDAWPQYNVYDPRGRWVGCTNCGAGWKSICKGIIKRHNTLSR